MVRFVTQAEINREKEAVATKRSQLRWYRERIRSRSIEIASLESRIAELEARLSRASPVERFISRMVIASLRRRLAAYRGWQTRDEAEVARLQRRIERELARLKEKVVRRLYRIKIRLYAIRSRAPPRPGEKPYYLTFQGFFDVDAILNPETGLPIWSWWLTMTEIEYAKYHFHGYWKGGVEKPKPFNIEEIKQAYLTEYTGISAPEPASR